LRPAFAGASGRAFGAARTGIALGALIAIIIRIIALMASVIITSPAVVTITAARRFRSVVSFIELPFEVFLIIVRIPILGQSVHFPAYIDV
jgi:hypothetical protein